MGFFRHDAIILTGDRQGIEEAHKRAFDLFAESAIHISEITQVGINGTCSFLIPPDGSKEGWEDSDEGDQLREEFITQLAVDGPLIDWIEVRFGGDESHEAWVRTPTDDDFRYVKARRDA